MYMMQQSSSTRMSPNVADQLLLHLGRPPTPTLSPLNVVLPGADPRTLGLPVPIPEPTPVTVMGAVTLDEPKPAVVGPNGTTGLESGNNCGEEYCPIYMNNRWMFNIVLYFGSTVAITSVIENCLIFYALIRDRRCFRTHFIFLLCLSLFDVVTSALYIPVIVVDQAKDRFDMPTMKQIWSVYFASALGAVNVALTASCYMIVVIQFERFLLAMPKYRKVVNERNRPYLSIMAIVGGLVMKGPIVFELASGYETNECNVTELTVHPAPFTEDNRYKIYQFWLRNFLTIFIPFGLLAYFNFRIISKMQKAQRRADLFQMTACNEMKNKARAATRTFVLIATTYLASNALNVFITGWEFIDITTLFVNYCEFYFFSTDIVSLLTLCGCALRLPIYLFTNAELRAVIHSAVTTKPSCPCARRNRSVALQSQAPPEPPMSSFDIVAITIALKFANANLQTAGQQQVVHELNDMNNHTTRATMIEAATDDRGEGVHTRVANGVNNHNAVTWWRQSLRTQDSTETEIIV